jgi:DEAD/DEAH box helicase domain-containing protein
LDASAAGNEETLHRAWRRWLQLFNSLQFMRGTIVVSADGLAAHDYDGLAPATQGVSPAQPATQAALNAAWQAVVDQASSALVPGLKQLAKAGVSPPQAGLELADTLGRVSADSELAWLDEKVVVLRPDQTDLAELWSAAGWKVFLLEETLTLVVGEPWASAVAAELGVVLVLNEGGTS